MNELRLTKKEIQNRLNTLKINPNGLQTRKYGVTTKYFSGNGESLDKRIDYEATVKVNINNGIGELELNKENVYFNQHFPDSINEIIADSIRKSLYPVKANINEKGILAEEINNHNEIVERWKSHKNNLLEKYKSDEFDSFLKISDNKFYDAKQLQKSLHYDWLWNLFSHPKFINYGDKREVERDLYLAVIPYQYPIKFSGVQKIEKIPTDYYSFTISFKSNELRAPSFFYPKSIEKERPLFMSLEVVFDLDLYHHFPMHTRANFEVYYQNGGNKEIFSKTLFTMYQLGNEEYKNKTLSVESPFITGGLVKLPPNKWGFDNHENLENDW